MSKYAIQSQVIDITSDSRTVKPGSIFLAYPGEKADGRQYIADAIEKGAAAVLWEPDGFDWDMRWQVENTPIKALKMQASNIAGQFYQNPSQKMWMIGVTGTNGKTSVTQWLCQCFTHLGRKTAVIGTLGNGFPNALQVTSNTTPDAVALQKMLANFVQENAETVAMEVSSHGLEQGRVRGVHFDLAVFTNLTHDHLDYHGSFEAYAAAKRKLFETKGLKFTIINADDDYGKYLIEAMRQAETPVMSYGTEDGDVRATELHFEATHFVFYAQTPFGGAPVKVGLIGRFNVYNVLAVLATLLASKVPLDDAVDAVTQITSAPGRMQMLGNEKTPLVVVDYAHTPDALEKVLQTLKANTEKRVICIFGCGGNRDTAKRSQMGKIASELASAVVVTSDNPRDENPEAIIQEIVSEMQGNFAIEADRAKAISIGIFSAQPGDIVLIAGKGHEDYQEIKGKKWPFSDLDEAKSVLKIYEDTRT